MSLNLDRILYHPSSSALPSTEKRRSHIAAPLKKRMSHIWRRSLTILSVSHEEEEDEDDDDGFDFSCKGEAEEVVTTNRRHEDYAARRDCRVWG